MLTQNKNTPGFTIIELLVVIVVIAALAAISFVAYSGIQERAQKAAVGATVSQVARKILAHIAEEGAPPSSLASAGIADPTDGTALSYAVDTDNPSAWRLSGIKGTIQYYWSSQVNSLSEGNCLGLMASLSSPGTVEGVRTVVFAGVLPGGTGWRYAFDLREGAGVYAVRPAAGGANFQTAGGAFMTYEDGIVVAHYASGTQRTVHVGRRHAGSPDIWISSFRAEVYSTALNPSQIAEAAERSKASL